MQSIYQIIILIFILNYSWYYPCQQLLSIFLKKMDEQKNFKLVKLNIEKNQSLVEKMGIDSVPTVFLVFKGKIIDSIIGFPDEERLAEFFTSITSLIDIDNEENVIQNLLREADELIKNKQWDLAENKFNEAFAFEKLKDKYGPMIKFGLGIIVIS